MSDKEAENIQAALEKLRARREAWIEEEYDAVFKDLERDNLTADQVKRIIKLALFRGYCEGMGASAEEIRPETTAEAKKMLERNPIFNAEGDDTVRH